MGVGDAKGGAKSGKLGTFEDVFDGQREVEAAVWAIQGYEIGKEVSVGKARGSYAEPGENDFEVMGWLVGGAPGTRGIF